MQSYLDELNPQQRAAVEYLGGPQLVIAGAGSGKTRVLTYKIVHLLAHGYDPGRILALTFTNKAAREMRQRICDLVGERTAARLWMGTFHSIFSRILRRHSDRIGFGSNYTIYDTSDSKSLVKTIIKDLQLDDKIYKPSVVLNGISWAKNALISPERYAADRELMQSDAQCRRPRMQEIYAIYCARCRVANAMDFDDLLYYTNVLLRDNPDILHHYQEFFSYILVDEYQDTNFAQHLIVSQLCRQTNSLCVVGDDAQSIYSFRGANIANILNLRQAYPDLQIFKLEQNYRSSQSILDAANALIAKNTHQIPKNVFSSRSGGNKVEVVKSYSDLEEGNLVANRISQIKMKTADSYEDFAILYRTNAQSRIIEESLRRRNIPYRVYGGLAFYQRKEVKDALAYMRLAVNPNDDEALRRIFNTPKRGLGETTLTKLTAASIGNSVSLFAAMTEPKAYGVDVNSGTAKKLEAFADMLNEFKRVNDEGANAAEITKLIIQRTRLLAELLHDNTPESISRQENLNELINGTEQFVAEQIEAGSDELHLADFLAEVSLATDQDSADDSTERVTMMTIHAAKGLEFGNVFIVGVEEDLLPSALSLDSAEEVEEERRLLYVAITRAKRFCMMSYSASRYLNGQTRICRPSRFLADIGAENLRLMTGATIAPPGRFEDFRSSYHSQITRPDAMPQHRPSAVPPQPQRQVRSAARTADTGGMSVHQASDLSVGMEVEHMQFGPGKIVRIDPQEGKVQVSFDGIKEPKTLLLKFAKFKILS